MADAPPINASIMTMVFDLGGVLIDWNPRHLYRKLFPGEKASMEAFLTTVVDVEWNAHQDAADPSPKQWPRPVPATPNTPA